MPKISVLIPVYNVSSYLAECLNSIINQTEKDIEIICVEDGSTDNSLQILQEYAQKDSRIHVIIHSENMGLCQTRKDAVHAATGQFCIFVDSDDFLSLDTCEKLYFKMTECGVDILQFNTEVIPSENTSSSMVEWVTEFMKPSMEKITDDHLVNACFVDHKFNCNLCNKIWKTSICKEAYSWIKNGHYVSAEDRYATFILSYFSKSYAGTLDIYYHYRLGVGITGGDRLNIFQFESRCSGASIVKNIWEFLQIQNATVKFSKAFDAFQEDILDDCVDCWHNKLYEKDFCLGYKLLLKYWGEEAVIGMIGKRYFEEQDNIYQRIQLPKRKNIAIYYRYIGYEAMNSIIQKYLEYLKLSSFHIIFITDADAPEKSNEYMTFPLFHIYAATDANWSYYKQRSHDLLNIIRHETIDEVYYLSPTSHIAKLDELTILAANKKYILCMDEFELDIVNRQAERINFLEIENVNLKKRRTISIKNLLRFLKKLTFQERIKH